MPSTTVPSTTGPASGSQADAVAACIGALERAHAAQASLLVAQQRLSAAQAALGAALTKASAAASASAAGAGSTTERSASSSTTSPGGSSASAGTRGAAGTGGTLTAAAKAARVSADDAAVLSARAAVASATADVSGATLHSPIDGVVGTLPFVPGARTTGAQQALVVGAGAVRVTADVPLASFRSVKVGQPATVTAEGTTSPAAGTVESVGLLPTSGTAGSSTTYPVVVLVPHPSKALLSGSAAAMTMVVATSRNVVTVPTSALTSTAAGSAITVLANGTATRTRVQVGTVGALVVQIRAGIGAGTRVVLADLSAPLPTTSPNTIRRFVPGVGAPGPGGFGGAAGSRRAG